MSLPAASFEPVISYLNLASPGAEIRSGKTGNSASLRRSGHTTICLAVSVSDFINWDHEDYNNFKDK